MRVVRSLTLALLTLATAAQAATPVTITVAPGGRQTFAGFGAGVGNWGRDYQRLTADERQQLASMIWRDLHLTSIRLWINLNEYAPTPDQRLTKDFRERYLDSGLVADAQRNGVTTLLLAPDNAPPWMKTPRPGGGPNDFAIKDESLDAYADVIAQFIAQIRGETGVLMNVTGVQNEPNDLDRLTPAQFPKVVKALRAALDRRGLTEVAVIAPEAANVDGIYDETIDAIKKDPEAWRAVGGLAFHSYSMAANDRAADGIAEGATGPNLKPFWMTEASANGPESPGDALRAASLATRFLSDMNRRTTHWQHFLAFERPDPNDNATRIVAYTAEPLRVTTFQKYHYYRQLTTAFDVGAVFRKSISDLDGTMTWTYGKKPRVTAAVAQNPDGGWAIGVANFTADAATFNDDPNDPAGSENGYKSKTFDVTVVVPELADAGDRTFAIRRSSGTLADAPEQDVVMHNGRLTLPAIGPLELITARTR